MGMRTVGDKVYSHDSNCIYSVAKSNGDSIEFSLSIAEQRAIGFILAWSLAFLQLSYLPQHNGIAKRAIAIIFEMVRCMLCHDLMAKSIFIFHFIF